MPIERDDKDWTWVIERRCPECGFDASQVSGTEVGRLLRDELPVWRAALARPDATQRPDDSTWSPTEYGAHVRDVGSLYAARLHRMMTEQDPEYLNWSPDDAAEEGGYPRLEPDVVVAELECELGLLADAFDRVPADGWSRTGRRSDGARFTVDTFSRYLLHDIVHHGWDVTGRPQQPAG